MALRIWIVLSLVSLCLLAYLISDPVRGCCPAPPKGKPVVNADQTVIMIWDAATKTQHFIRQASFKSEADDFGFLVPSPTQPDLDESGNDAFPYLLKLTEPEIKKMSRPTSCAIGCSKTETKQAAGSLEPRSVKVLLEKTVAGFDAKVLETKSTEALVQWLKDNGYAFSPEVEAWAKPYVDQGWKITALKVAKNKDAKETRSVAAAALRMTFKTDRPLFPYREPDYKSAADVLGAKRRLLRIYFLAEARYQGELTKEVPWTGQVAWAGKLKPEDRKKVLEQLKLPENTGPQEWWLTEFEDMWPYKVAPADVYFSPDANQAPRKREPIIQYVSMPYPTDASAYALAAALVLPPLWVRLRRRWRK